jgi:hypothetical protein
LRNQNKLFAISNKCKLRKEVEILVNEQKLSGNFEVEFNAANLPSGVSFYQLKAGNYVETKKMMLIK